MPFSHLADNLDKLAQQGLYRSRRTIASPQGIHLQLGGKSAVNFCSNDYLGLANHPAVVQAFRDAADTYGVGSGSAHLIAGIAPHTTRWKTSWRRLPDASGRCCFPRATWRISASSTP